MLVILLIINIIPKYKALIYILKAIDCFIIGNIAYQNKDYYHANNWLKVAYEEAKTGTFEKLKIIERV